MSAPPDAATLLTLSPRVDREEAVRRLAGGALRRLLAPAPLRAVAPAFLPFHLFHVDMTDRGRSWRGWLAIDAVSGTLDPYEFDHPPTGDELIRLDSRNRPAPRLDAAAASAALRDKLRRLRYQAGFFRVRDLRFALDPAPLALHVPYWLGFYGSGAEATLRVLDAVRCRFEGGRARALFRDWLAA